MTKTWFTADTHFGHQSTLELSKRPFKSLGEMNNAMIGNWNSVVGENDTVYHLGDFGDLSFVELLNGKIHLLLGNYERNDINKGLYSMNLLSKKFYAVYESNTFGQFNQKTYRMVHEPSHNKSETFSLFGHIHKLQMIKRNGLNVGVDCHNFYPIDLETVEFYRNAIENHYDEEVFGS